MMISIIAIIVGVLSFLAYKYATVTRKHFQNMSFNNTIERQLNAERERSQLGVSNKGTSLDKRAIYGLTAEELGMSGVTDET